MPFFVRSALALVLAVSPAAFAQDVRYLDTIFGDEDILVTEHQYGSAMNNLDEEQALLLDLYEPDEAEFLDSNPDFVRPVIIWAHGGSFKGGNKTSGNVRTLSREFAKRGWVTASITYRLRPPGTPGSMPNQDIIVEQLATNDSPTIRDARHDMQAAVRWFRKNAEELRIDPETIVVGGTSAGAVTALFAHTNAEDPGDSGNPGFSSVTAAAVSLAGSADPRDVAPGDGPMVLFHGTHDTTVPYALGFQTCVTQLANTNICELTTIPGGTHGNGTSASFHPEIADFLCRHVIEACEPNAVPEPFRFTEFEPGDLVGPVTRRLPDAP